MKQSRTCPKCKHNRVLYIDQVSDLTSDAEDSHKITGSIEPEPKRQYSCPWRIARIPIRPKDGFFGSVVEVASAGLVEAFICKSCGYTELYTKDPSQIPIDGTYVQELVGPKTEEPYR
jgi:predicted nucleic-acid-binding Zn-ribbon protein